MKLYLIQKVDNNKQKPRFWKVHERESIHRVSEVDCKDMGKTKPLGKPIQLIVVL
jgi:hypothetical protein